MNKMRIPRILRAITWISIPVFVISLAARLLLYGKQPADLPDWLRPQASLLMSVVNVLFPVSFVLMLTAFNFSFLFDWVLNGLLRRFGIPAALNKTNFKKYKASSVTDFKEFPGRTHYIIGQTNWEEVADAILAWLNEKRV